MLKRQWGAESNGKLPHLFIHSKTATLVPEFVVENLSLDRTATLVPAFAVKDLLLGRTLVMMMMIIIIIIIIIIVITDHLFGVVVNMSYCNPRGREFYSWLAYTLEIFCGSIGSGTGVHPAS